MEGVALHESLALDRHRYERLLLMRMGGVLTREDAEDIVSDALVRIYGRIDNDAPQAGKADGWFGRIVLNQGIDFLRARDGRNRDGNGSRRPVLVRLADIDEESPALAADGTTEALDLKRSATVAERAQARDLVGRVMTALDPKDAELVKLRHIVADGASREQVAAMAGMTVGEYRWRYDRAWNRFVEAIALDAPAPRCERVRALLGEIEAAAASPDVVAEVDAHTLDCASCRVFARESYRALELLPFAPVVGFAERWTARIGCWWERSGPEATTGAGSAAAGAGVTGLLGGGGAAGVLKTIVVVCSATAVTASVCAGIAVVLHDPGAPDRTPANQRPRAAVRTPTPTPASTAVPIATAAPTPRPRRATARTRRRSRARTAPTDTSGAAQIPASAPAGASEFSPSASSASIDPAPPPTAGGGEFTP